MNMATLKIASEMGNCQVENLPYPVALNTLLVLVADGLNFVDTFFSDC